LVLALEANSGFKNRAATSSSFDAVWRAERKGISLHPKRFKNLPQYDLLHRAFVFT
jgi:hypothetical protein